MACLVGVAGPAYSACSSWMGSAWLNEYYFGSSATPNFIELFSASKTFPSSWQGWHVRLYSGVDTYVRYDYNDNTATACTQGGKTFVTYPVAGGLSGTTGMAVLYDNTGAPVDAFVFDQSVPPDPWKPSSKWASTLSAECPALASALDAQSAAATRPYYGQNMQIWQTQGNKDYGRTPDGTGVWADSSYTGGNTTFTECSSNKGTIAKTVNSSYPIPGETIAWTVVVTNNGKSDLTGVKVDDRYYKTTGATADMACSTPTVTAGTVSATPTGTAPPAPAGMTAIGAWGWTVGTVVKNGGLATLTMSCTIPASAAIDTVYRNYAITTAGVTPATSDWAQVTVSSPGPNHIRLVHDGQGGVCSGDTVTLKACADAACSTLYTGGVAVTLSPATGWPTNPVAIGASGSASVTYTTDLAGVTRYAITSHPFLCDNTSTATAGNVTTECDVAFADNEFVVEATDSLASVPVAGRPHRMKITAYRKQGAQCGIATNYQGSKNLKAWYSDAAGLTPSPLPKLSTAADCGVAFPAAGLPATEPAGTNATLTFANGVADPFYLCTGDVGKYSLAFKDPSPTIVTGTSPVLTVRPFALAIWDIKAGTTANPATGFAVTDAKFIPAADPYQATIGAYRHNAAADVNDDGYPDVAATLAQVIANGSTAGFGTLPSLASALAYGSEPSCPGPSAGTLSVGTMSFAGGVATPAGMKFSEAGCFKLVGGLAGGAAVANYLGSASVNLVPSVFSTATAASQAVAQNHTVGRFYPKAFALGNPFIGHRADLATTGSISSGSLALTVASASGIRVGDTLAIPGAGAGGASLSATATAITGTSVTLSAAAGSTVSAAPVHIGTFTYLDEPFQASFTLTALNAEGAVTQNYSGSYVRLGGATASTWTTYSTDGSTQALGIGAANGTTPLSSRLSVHGGQSGSFTNGIGTFGAQLKLLRSTVAPPDGPYAVARVGIAPQDGDGVRLRAADLTLDAQGATATTAPDGTPERGLLGAMEQRFGRLRLVGAYGSELLPPRVEMRAEYWDGSRWTVNTLDSATPIAAGNIATGGLAVSSVTPLGSGIGYIRFGTAAAGSYDIAVNLDPAATSDHSCNAAHPATTPAGQPWLRGFWSSTCGGFAPWAQDPNARVRLGSPQAPYIYLRERY